MFMLIIWTKILSNWFPLFCALHLMMTEVDKKKIEIFDLFLKILKDLKTYDTIKWLN